MRWNLEGCCERCLEFFFEVALVFVFLTELFAQLHPPQRNAAILADAAEPVRKPGVDIKRQRRARELAYGEAI